MNLAEMYYHQAYGCYPFKTEGPLLKTQKIIQHLKDAGISDSEILRVIEEAPRAKYLTPELLPEWLWEESLLEKGVFYFHKEFHIKPGGPKLDPKTGRARKQPFYLEMKIRFTLDDLLDYYYRKAGVEEELKNPQREKGAFKNLLQRYRKISFVEPIDFIMALIDQHAENDYGYIASPFDITRDEADVYRCLKQKAQEAELAGANRIIWR